MTKRHGWISGGLSAAMLVITGGILQGQAPAPVYLPPLLSSGNNPASLPPLSQVVGGGEVALEVSIDQAGVPTRIDVLRKTPPYTDMLVAAVRGWRFTPARVETAVPASAGKPATTSRVDVPSKALVVAINNSPTVIGPSLGTPPETVKSASPEVAWPAALHAPPVAPQSVVSVVVLVEVRVGASGRVDSARVLRGAASYDRPSLDAVRGWKFRAARRGTRAVPSVVYVVFGFPVPTNPAP